MSHSGAGQTSYPNFMVCSPTGTTISAPRYGNVVFTFILLSATDLDCLRFCEHNDLPFSISPPPLCYNLSRSGFGYSYPNPNPLSNAQSSGRALTIFPSNNLGATSKGIMASIRFRFCSSGLPDSFDGSYPLIPTTLFPVPLGGSTNWVTWRSSHSNSGDCNSIFSSPPGYLISFTITNCNQAVYLKLFDDIVGSVPYCGACDPDYDNFCDCSAGNTNDGISVPFNQLTQPSQSNLGCTWTSSSHILVIAFPNVFPVQITANVSIKPSARRLQNAANALILPFSGSGILPNPGSGVEHHHFLQPFSDGDSATSSVNYSVSAPFHTPTYTSALVFFFLLLSVYLFLSLFLPISSMHLVFLSLPSPKKSSIESARE